LDHLFVINTTSQLLGCDFPRHLQDFGCNLGCLPTCLRHGGTSDNYLNLAYWPTFRLYSSFAYACQHALDILNTHIPVANASTDVPCNRRSDSLS
jgi:hypothetical protein